MVAKVIDADPSELRDIARSLRQSCLEMDTRTKDMAAEFLAFSDVYRDPDSAGVGRSCMGILKAIEDLSPQVEEAAVLIEAYARSLEG